MAPLHICEVVINTVSDALTAVYGDRWPWSTVFETSLPGGSIRGYDPRSDLQAVRRQQATTGKVVPELKFVFWQKMFTSRYDVRVQDVHLQAVLPNLDPAKTVAQLRQQIYLELDHVRILRNRIAHHEPIFRRNLTDDLDKIAALVGFRCKVTADWMMQCQRVGELL